MDFKVFFKDFDYCFGAGEGTGWKRFFSFTVFTKKEAICFQEKTLHYSIAIFSHGSFLHKKWVMGHHHTRMSQKYICIKIKLSTCFGLPSQCETMACLVETVMYSQVLMKDKLENDICCHLLEEDMFHFI